MATLNKIQVLSAFAYSSEKEGHFELTESMINGVKKTLGILPEKEVLDFVSQYGFGYFTSEVGIIPTELPPVVTKDHPVCPVGRFFGFCDGKNSIDNIIKTYGIPEQISIRFFPLCDGVSGDLFLYSLEEKSFGKIYYWYHEGDIGNDLFLVRDSFNAFIEDLQSFKPPVAQKGKVKRTFISPKMLELMNETRVQNGLPPLTEKEALDG